MKIIFADDSHKQQIYGILFEFLRWMVSSTKRHTGIDMTINNQFEKIDDYVAQMVLTELEEFQKYQSPHGRFVLIKDVNKIKGIGAVSALTEKSAEIKRVYVRPDFQRKGIGKTLVRELIEFARISQFEEVFLDTWNWMTPAIDLYSKMGFKKIDGYFGGETQSFLKQNPDASRSHFQYFRLEL